MECASAGAFASGTAGYIVGHSGSKRPVGHRSARRAYVAGQAGYILGGHVVLPTPQNFNNTGQTTPVPVFQSGGSYAVIAANGSQSTTYTGATIAGSLNYPFAFTWIYPLDLTGWTQVVFTAKSKETDADSAAVLTVKLSNPGAGGDGLTPTQRCGSPYRR